MIEGLPETVNQTKGKARVFLRGGEDVRSVIIELEHTNGKLSAEIVISAATQGPCCRGVAWSHVLTEVGYADQSMHKEMNIFIASGELRAKKNVVLPLVNSSIVRMV